MNALRTMAEERSPVGDLADAILDRTGYVAELQASSDLQDASRIELIRTQKPFRALRSSTPTALLTQEQRNRAARAAWVGPTEPPRGAWLARARRSCSGNKGATLMSNAQHESVGRREGGAGSR